MKEQEGDINCKCDCWIGILNDYDQCELNNLYMSDYIAKAEERQRRISQTCSVFGRLSYVKSALGIIDRRRGHATLFSFCPNCGERIEWVKLRKFMRALVS